MITLIKGVKIMTLEEFNSFKRGLSLDIVKFNRGKMDKEEFYKSMVTILGKDIFEETIQVFDNDVPK
jgi:hypothetical protein